MEFSMLSMRAQVLRRVMPDWPAAFWLMAAALGLGIFAGLPASSFVAQFNAGWGWAAGEFALILIPSFILAAVFEQRKFTIPPRLAVVAAPLAGAGMVCPDTAFAALSPLASSRRLSVAFGNYAGFKLMFPAGPLIVGTSLGAVNSTFFIYCVAVFFPVWLIGLAFARIFERAAIPCRAVVREKWQTLWQIWPFAMLVALLGGGFWIGEEAPWPLDFIANPKGALLLTGIAALLTLPRPERRGCLDAALRRTASLLFIIGAASALGALLGEIFALGDWFAAQSELAGLASIFVLAALLKILQGSSMATFAAAGPLALPIVEASAVSPALAALALCLGSLAAILPNDSFYWLVRRGALAERGEMQAAAILNGGALAQAAAGFAALCALYCAVG